MYERAYVCPSTAAVDCFQTDMDMGQRERAGGERKRNRERVCVCVCEGECAAFVRSSVPFASLLLLLFLLCFKRFFLVLLAAVVLATTYVLTYSSYSWLATCSHLALCMQHPQLFSSSLTTSTRSSHQLASYGSLFQLSEGREPLAESEDLVSSRLGIRQPLHGTSPVKM